MCVFSGILFKLFVIKRLHATQILHCCNPKSGFLLPSVSVLPLDDDLNFILFHIHNWSFIQCEQEQFIMLSILMKLPWYCPCFRRLLCKHRLWPNTVEFFMFLDNVKTDDPMWFLWLTVLNSVSHFELRASQSHNTVEERKLTLLCAAHYYCGIVNRFLGIYSYSSLTERLQLVICCSTWYETEGLCPKEKAWRKYQNEIKWLTKIDAEMEVDTNGAKRK